MTDAKVAATQVRLLEYVVALHAIVRSIDDTLAEINLKLANQSSGVSSVNLKTSARGHDVDVKVYAGSEVTSAGDAAVAEYFRVAKEIEKRLMGEV